jgi:hypothetical protein
MNNLANIVYDIEQIFIQNIFLLDNKRNIIMDGKFTKIVYSDNFFMTNGIFIRIPFLFDNFMADDAHIKQWDNGTKYTENHCRLRAGQFLKCFLLFKPTDAYNEKKINDLIMLEHCILEFYKQIFKCNKKTTTILKSQLHNGCIKIYVDSEEYDILMKTKFPLKHGFTLKISGIWEDFGNIGLTYKFMHDFDVL